MTENAKEMSDPHPSLPEAAGTGRGETALSADAIVEYVRQEEHFPPNCDALWALNPLVEGSGQRLISYVLWRLGTSALKGAVLLDPTPRFQGVADRFWPAMVAGLFEAGQSNADLLNAAVEFLRVMPPDELCALLHSQGQAVRQFYPKSNRALGLRLGEVLDSLREGPEQFRWRLRLLAQWKDWFEDRSEAERRLGQWQRFCNAMAEVARIREVEKRLKKLAWINWFGWLGRKKDYQDVMPKLAARIREAISRQASPADPDPELATIWRRARRRPTGRRRILGVERRVDRGSVPPGPVPTAAGAVLASARGAWDVVEESPGGSRLGAVDGRRCRRVVDAGMRPMERFGSVRQPQTRRRT